MIVRLLTHEEFTQPFSQSVSVIYKINDTVNSTLYMLVIID